MRNLVIIATMIATPAFAGTFVDQYGRTVTCTGAGPVTCTSGDGLSVQTASETQASGVFNGMAPASWVPPALPAPTPAQQATALLSGGLAITSTSTPSLNGTYSIDPSAQSNINAVQTYILTTPGQFPTGSSMPWIDTSGAAHVFTSTAQFTAFAKVAAQVASQVTLYGAGVLASPPAMTATIP